MSDLTLTWAQVHACLAAKYGKRAFDALDDLLCATIGSERLMDEAADEIVTRLRHVAWLAEEGSDVTDLAATAADEITRLRAVLDDIAAHVRRSIDGEPRSEYEAGYDEACIDVLAILPPMTLDEAIDALDTVHK